MKDAPYFSLDHLAFQTPGSAIESQINRDKAVEFVHNYVYSGGCSSDAGEALDFLSRQYGKVAKPCSDIKATFALDGFLERELVDAICKPALYLIKKRLGITYP